MIDAASVTLNVTPKKAKARQPAGMIGFSGKNWWSLQDQNHFSSNPIFVLGNPSKSHLWFKPHLQLRPLDVVTQVLPQNAQAIDALDPPESLSYHVHHDSSTEVSEGHMAEDNNVQNFNEKFTNWFRSRPSTEKAQIGLAESLGNFDGIIQTTALYRTREHLHGEAYGIEDLMEHCESPIERALLAAVLITADFEVNFFQLPFEMFTRPAFHIHPQFEIEKFRIDFQFTLQLWDHSAKTLTKFYSVLVECDGHDFHERTKEQARRDRAKDRFFQHSGLPLLRFTGSEIYKDPFKCANEIHRFLVVRASEAPHGS